MTWTLVNSNSVGFADGNTGHVYTLPSGAPSVGDLDILAINSDTTVSTPSGFSVATSFVNSQGSYFFYRFAVGGEASTVTVTTAGNFDTALEWLRWQGGSAFDVAANAHVDGTSGTSTPAVTTAALATSNDLVVAFAALHTPGAGAPTGVTWSSGYTAAQQVAQVAVAGLVGYKTGAGTAAEAPSVSWTGVYFDRYILVATFTPAAPAGGSTAVQPLVPPLPPGRAADTRPAILSSNQPLGNPATPTRGPLVIGPQPGIVPVPGAKLFAAPAQPGAPGPLLVSPPFSWPYIPPVSVTASQPLGNPAVGTRGPLVVSAPWAAKVPGAVISSNPAAPVISTVGTPGPLVVTPPFTPVPVPLTYLSASQPLGNPATATPQPLVVSTFTLAPVPGAKVFSAPAPPTFVAVPTPGPLVVTPPWQPVAIPPVVLSASQPLGQPAVASPQPLVVGPLFRWPTWTAPLITAPVSHSCVTPRPNTGTTTRPNSGTTAYALATTARPNTGTTARPNTGTTKKPC